MVAPYASANAESYDVAIAGGGLAGLALSIQLANNGHSVILFEKEEYPFHKVCGEYISMESWDFLVGLGLDLQSMNASRITRLQVSSITGTLLEQGLDMGGFGISRYRLDEAMAKLAQLAGVVIHQGTKVNDIRFTGSEFIIETKDHNWRSAVACGSYGKRSNLDLRWKRPFTSKAKNKLNNYVGVKYHINCNFPEDTIALHNFSNGYCGVVKIEDDQYCLCYLTSAENLHKAKGSIPVMEKTVLAKNPFLQKLFRECKIAFETPITISQISFDKKTQLEDHVLMIGDAAGMITPLCGNGMSMALHASKLAAEQISKFLSGEITREQMEIEYGRQWQQNFSSRLRMGRRIQRLFGKSWLTNTFIGIAKRFPPLTNYLVRQTHGQPF